MHGLIVETGAHRGKVFELTEDVMTLGRSANCRIHIECDDISREHARISRDGPRCVIEDLGSRNGTCVNGAFVKRKVLKDGDKITIGGHVIRFAETLKPEDRTLPHDVVQLVNDPDAHGKAAATPSFVARDAETNPWAIVSLACLLGGVFWPMAALAIVVGVVALLKIKERGDQKGAQLAVAAIVIGSLICSYHAYDKGLRSAFLKARGKKLRLACRTNLIKIAHALAQYSADSRGEFPKNLTDLYPQYISDRNVFVCPGDNAPFTGANNILCSYEVGPRPNSPGAQNILAYDHNAANHQNLGRNALFTDHHVEWIDEPDLAERLKTSEKP
ncbi:MAG: FHA domain-containing protein [Planctomycetes bacterium]|nr:FHA domain-containing protein [Planctomycetota bacterium]